MIGGAMTMRRACYSIFFVILLCALLLWSSEGKRTMPYKVFVHEGRPTTRSPKINAETEVEAWSHCKKEMADAIKDSQLHMAKASNDLISVLLGKQGIDKAIDILPTKLREKVSDCLRKNGLNFHTSDLEATFKQWFHITPSPSPAIAPDIAPRPAPESAPSPSPVAISYGPALVPFSFGVAPSPQDHADYLMRSHQTGRASVNSLITSNMVSTSSKSPDGKKSSKSSDGKKSDDKKPDDKKSSKSPDGKKSSKSESSSSPGSHNKSHKSNKTKVMEETIAAVVATAATTFALVALLFCCCCLKRSRREKDEKPLLGLNDYLSDSSQKSISLGSSSNNKEFYSSSQKNLSLAGGLSMKQDNFGASVGKSPLSDATEEASFPSLKPPPGRAAPPPAAPPPPPPRAAPPPPPPKGARPPPTPPKSKPAAPLAPHRRGRSASGSGGASCSADETDDGAAKAKLKPFFWDKVMANSGKSMVWHEISAGSFQFNEEMIESLFGYTNVPNNKNNQKREPSEAGPQYIRIIDARKAQNLSILLRALNVTTQEVVDALQKGNELPAELLQTLQKMAPTQEEELKLRLFTGDINLLGPAERFLKVVVEIPSAFKRIESLLFMINFNEDVTGVKESFSTLEVACNKLKSSRLFLKLLEAVLKTGNRMNDGTYRGGAQAFKLDTLLKLSDVKGADGKTTLLHFVVQEMIRSEGRRAVRTQPSRSISSINSEDIVVEDRNPDIEDHYCNLGLQVVSGVSTELADVKTAAAFDADAISSTVSKLNQSLRKAREFLNFELKGTDDDEGCEFFRSLSGFLDRADADIKWISEEEKRIMELVQSTADYFHGRTGRNEGLRLFAIVRDFLMMLDRACKEVKDARAKQAKINASKDKEGSTKSPRSVENRQPSSSENRQRSLDMNKQLFPAISDRRMDSSSSDDESSSDD